MLFRSDETLAHWVVAACDNDYAVSSLGAWTRRRLDESGHASALIAVPQPSLTDSPSTLPDELAATSTLKSDLPSCAGESTLRRLQAADLDQPALIDSLTALVLGNAAAPSAAPNGAIAAAGGAAAASGATDPLTSRSAASTAVRLRALGYLHKSVGAASRFPGTLQANLPRRPSNPQPSPNPNPGPRPHRPPGPSAGDLSFHLRWRRDAEAAAGRLPTRAVDGDALL